MEVEMEIFSILNLMAVEKFRARNGLLKSGLLKYHPPQLLQGLDEDAECRIILIAPPVGGGIAASGAASILPLLDAEGAGAGTGGQVAEESQGKSPGELVQLFVRQALQAVGEQISPSQVLPAGCGDGSLCLFQGGGMNCLCGCLKLSSTRGHIQYASHSTVNKRIAGKNEKKIAAVFRYYFPACWSSIQMPGLENAGHLCQNRLFPFALQNLDELFGGKLGYEIQHPTGLLIDLHRPGQGSH